jgi:PAS domain S-box-containing protein
MKPPLRILHLEDDPADAALIQTTLDAAGIPCATTRVQTRDDFVSALEKGGVDLVLSDFFLPSFDGLAAAKIMQARWPAIPFILVSGTLGEERAIESMQNGATDYVLKDRLTRLCPAVRRAMEEVEGRAAQRQTQEALRLSQQRLQIIFNESPAGIALVGEDGLPVLTNPALQTMLGYTGEELSRMHFCDFTHPDDRAKDTELYGELTQGSRQSYQMEKRFIRKDGREIWANLSVSLAREAAGHASFAIGIIKDITERRCLEAQLIEAQKMEVIGQLAGGVAHDFNNILAVIMGYSDMLIVKLHPDSPLQKDAQTILHAAERAAALTRQLLVFSRKQIVQPVVLDLNVVVKDMEKMLARLIDENVELVFALDPQTGRLKADPGYVGQVLMNLVVNARDAMPDGGKITVETANAVLDPAYALAHPGAIPGDYVMLSVSDTGTGMTDEVKGRLFEAFFTTKPKGKGTGLGLATCQTIVQQCGGHIEVASELGRGTTFRIYFPRVQQAAAPAGNSVKKSPMPRGTETLLLVEDEPAVRHLACDVLRGQGYQVLSANNGQDGLHEARQHKGTPISLVVTDVIMPQMGGKVMAEWLKSSYPNLKILFTSGYTDDAIAHHGVLDPGVAFLPKPYTPATLARTVRELLDKP